MLFRFSRTVLLLIALSVLALSWPLTAWADGAVVRSVIAAGLIAFVNVVLGFVALAYAIDKPTSPFMVAVFGGMGIRMGLILIAMTLLLLGGFHALSLALSLMGFYVMFMVAELYYVVSELNAPVRQTSRRQPAAFASPSTLAVNLIHVDARP